MSTSRNHSLAKQAIRILEELDDWRQEIRSALLNQNIRYYNASEGSPEQIKLPTKFTVRMLIAMDKFVEDTRPLAIKATKEKQRGRQYPAG